MIAPRGESARTSKPAASSVPIRSAPAGSLANGMVSAAPTETRIALR